ncbi:hypothetical protein F5Y19DRAFT_472711 [Xylariaceae sp. FL1651]|nr:hypothetical protein F5Y19DRAFT_472711 [Xylariaceae sp. FL1651]
MQLTSVLSLLAASSVVVAAPTPDQIFARASTSPVSCGPAANQRAWPLQSVQDAFDALQNFGNVPANQRPKAGTRSYPQQYGNNQGVPTDADVVKALDAIPECKTAQSGYKFFEFPITDPVFSGGDQGSQGPDRVIAIAQNPGQGGTRSYTYCLAITHRGINGGGFQPCTSSP